MSPLAIPELERMVLGGCQVPGCKHEHKKQDKLYFRQRCHPGAGLERVLPERQRQRDGGLPKVRLDGGGYWRGAGMTSTWATMSTATRTSTTLGQNPAMADVGSSSSRQKAARKPPSRSSR